MKQNKDALIRAIEDYHQKVQHYKAIEEDYHRLKALENKIQVITVQKHIPSQDVMDEYITERVWKSVVAEMASNIAELLGEGNGLHLEQSIVMNPYGGADLRMTTQFKFIRTMGKR